MLTLKFRGWSWSFELKRGEELVASGDLSHFRERGRIRTPERDYEVRRKGLFGEFEVRDGGRVLGTARKPSAFRRRFEIVFGKSRYDLAKGSFTGRRYVLHREGREVGSVRRRGWFRRTSDVELPAELPPGAQAFVVWLVVILWRRSARND